MASSVADERKDQVKRCQTALPHFLLLDQVDLSPQRLLSASPPLARSCRLDSTRQAATKLPDSSRRLRLFCSSRVTLAVLDDATRSGVATASLGESLTTLERLPRFPLARPSLEIGRPACRRSSSFSFPLPRRTTLAMPLQRALSAQAGTLDAAAPVLNPRTESEVDVQLAQQNLRNLDPAHSLDPARTGSSETVVAEENGASTAPSEPKPVDQQGACRPFAPSPPHLAAWRCRDVPRMGRAVDTMDIGVVEDVQRVRGSSWSSSKPH